MGKALWIIPAGRMKARREHVVPLPTQAMVLLNAMRPITGHTKFVFPNRDDRQRPMADAALRQALKKLGWATKYPKFDTSCTQVIDFIRNGLQSVDYKTGLAKSDG
ncbi:tyrosine-type recombinase/integrase, partial [Rhodoferax antarcticus]|uniref:tyrosine-type recombinase/integrase n=1 Tax=Rhodoferax antarcticus TaxID=81479 RepID=UPI003872A822|nr:integrase [Rhodoferax antarcticus]